VALLQSPNGNELPPGLGTFDIVIMSAVFEHLLPAERKVILRKLWELLRPGGALFLNQTPNRAFPIEVHSTMLPLLNYLPDKLTAAVARRFSERVYHDESWETLLRKGMRGGTESEVLRLLRAAGAGEPELLEPSRMGHRDRIDLWYNTRPPERRSLAFRAGRAGMKAIRALTGITLTPNLSLAVRKAA
jgi:SAM-dependent methyltransferase